MKGEGDRSIFKHRPFLSMSWAEDLNTGTMARTIALYVHCYRRLSGTCATFRQPLHPGQSPVVSTSSCHRTRLSRTRE